jgi:hypothetical protein
MFRDDDGPWYGREKEVMHPTYRNKPRVGFQEAARQMPVEETPGVKLGTVLDKQAPIVPTTFDTIYEPQHPKADWTGSVAINERAHYTPQNHRALSEGITTELEGGYVGKHETSMFLNRRRGTGPSMTATTPGLIGGIDGSPDRYTSVARAAAQREPTGRDQMTLGKRTLGIKQVGNPAQQASSRQPSAGGSGTGSRASGFGGNNENVNVRDYNDGFSEGSQASSRNPDLPLLGFKAPPQTMSFSKGLGASLVASIGAAPAHKVAKADQKDTNGANAPIPGYTGYRGRGKTEI